MTRLELSQAASDHLYWIAQEALANAMNHAGARNIALRLTIEPDQAVLAVEDDGRGFAADDRKPDRFGDHFGRVAKTILEIRAGGQASGAGNTVCAQRQRAVCPQE